MYQDEDIDNDFVEPDADAGSESSDEQVELKKKRRAEKHGVREAVKALIQMGTASSVEGKVVMVETLKL